MTNFSFERDVNRFGTNSVKWDFIKKNNLPENTLPLWIADMDFPTVPEVITGLTELAQTGIWGYSFPDDKYFEAVMNWQLNKNQWSVEKDWIVVTPGVVPAINLAINAFSNQGDCILIQEPVYHPFRKQIEILDRKVISADLTESNNNYTIDYLQLENLIVQNQIKLFIFCSPHNPVGRVWTKEELIKLGDICLKHEVLIVSDEIHHDLIMPGYKHHVLANLKPEYSEITLTCTAPSKTFNLAGLSISNIIISNPQLRKKFEHASEKSCFPGPSPFGIKATEIAFNKGEAWLNKLLIHVKNQYERLDEAITQNNLPLKLSPLQGTYLAWLDCRAISSNPSYLNRLFLDEAGLWFNNGSIFGKSGNGYIRINLACSTDLFIEVLQRLVTVIKNL